MLFIRYTALYFGLKYGLVDKILIFQPSRSWGLVFHAVVIILLTVGGVWSLLQASQAQVGPVFLLYLLLALIALGLVPLFLYRAYALRQATYLLERDGLHLRWGLRAESIPMGSVQWVDLADRRQPKLPLPWLRWPGSLLGRRRLKDGTQVEFLAENPGRMVLIATEGSLFVISPEQPDAYLEAFQRFNEMGSLTPLHPSSVYPSFLLSRVWANRAARSLLISGFALALIVLIMASLAIPTRSVISLGFHPNQTLSDLVPSVQLLLLPVLNFFFLIADFLAGLFFFRRSEVAEDLARSDGAVSRMLAFVLWGSAVVTGLLFLVALYVTLEAS
jgi:hypothetical protein